MARYDRIVIGGRLVGSAIAYGLVRAGCWRRYSTRATSFSALARQFPARPGAEQGRRRVLYHRWTRRSADEWPTLAAELLAKTGSRSGPSGSGASPPR
jgi:hydrogen cyanide synthase HcnC